MVSIPRSLRAFYKVGLLVGIFFSIFLFFLLALRVNYGTYSQAFFVLSKKRFAFVGFGGSSNEF